MAVLGELLVDIQSTEAVARRRMDVYELDDVRTPNVSFHCYSIQALAGYVRADGKKLERGRTGC